MVVLLDLLHMAMHEFVVAVEALLLLLLGLVLVLVGQDFYIYKLKVPHPAITKSTPYAGRVHREHINDFTFLRRGQLEDKAKVWVLFMIFDFVTIKQYCRHKWAKLASVPARITVLGQTCCHFLMFVQINMCGWRIQYSKRNPVESSIFMVQ